MNNNKEKVSTRKIVAFTCYIFCVVFLIVFVSNKIKIGDTNTTTGTNSTTGITIGDYFPAVVVSGSMEPVIMTNSINLCVKATMNDIEVGDIVAFTYYNEMVTHRVIEKYTDENNEWYLRTKGDNNDFVDKIYVRDYMIRGKVIKTWNESANIVSKYLISPGEIDSLALAQTIIWLFITAAIIGVTGYWLWGFVGMLLKVSIKDSAYEKELQRLDKDIQSMIDNKDYLEKLINTYEEDGKTKGFNKLARARVMREIKANSESVKDFNKAIKQAKLIEKLGEKKK